MGNHFLPQQHQRRFQIPDRPEFIWMYDRRKRVFKDVAIDKAAQSAGYYSPEIERDLANEIEKPGNKALDKVRNREALTNSERSRLSLYMLTMATRGPHQRKKSIHEIAPKALEKTLNDLEMEVRTEILMSGGHPKAKALLNELDRVGREVRKKMPERIQDLIRTPFSSDRAASLVHTMAWHVVPATALKYYITSDTPVHISPWAGLGKENSELTFAISSDLALIGERRSPAGLYYHDSDADIVDEVNRRMVAHSERLVFSHTNDQWITDLADNPQPLNCIRWGPVPV